MYNVLEVTWLVITTTMVGRLSVAATWQIMFLWSLELFPTTIRATVLGLSMLVGRLGGSMSPFINNLVRAATK